MSHVFGESLVCPQPQQLSPAVSVRGGATAVRRYSVASLLSPGLAHCPHPLALAFGQTGASSGKAGVFGAGICLSFILGIWIPHSDVPHAWDQPLSQHPWTQAL